MENHILPWFGSMRLVDITQADIDRWLASMPADQEAMKANALKALKSILRSASKPGLHGEPPLIPVYPATKSLPKPERKTRTVPATPEEVKAIYDAMPEHYRMAVYLAVFGDGLRIGEVCALQRQDIDSPSRTMHIRRGRVTMDPDRLTDTPRPTGAYVTSSYRPNSYPCSRPSYRNRWGESASARLFPAANNPYDPIHPNVLRGAFERARDAAGRPDPRFHDLRHTGLTWLAAEGATVRELMDAAGHADVTIAMRYHHSMDARRAELAEKLGERLLPDETPELIKSIIVDLNERIDELKEQVRCEEARLLQLKS